jgi:beta-glucosidase/6-phospho-beta-glucosidase/beta-galactosidase
MNSFLWGVATSAYQSEGGYNGPGEPQTNWAKAEKRGDVMVAGASAEFWTRYSEDFARCRAMGLNAFRLGIEWSRIQPQRPVEGAPGFDFAALDHYTAMLIDCRKHGLEPVLTLHHFVHPAWLPADAWLDPAILPLFVEYVRTSVAYLNESLVKAGELPIHYYITINEPNMLAVNTYLGDQFPGEARRGVATVNRSYNQLLAAHVHAYNIIHDLYSERGWKSPQVTVNNYCSDLYWSDKFLLDLLNLRECEVPRDRVTEHILQKAHEFNLAFEEARIPLHRDVAYHLGKWVKWFSDWLGYRFFHVQKFSALLDVIYASPRSRLFDYIGLDYYDPFMAHAFRIPVIWDHEFKSKSFRSWVMASISSKWWDWRVLPLGLHFFCKYYSADFQGRPLLIAENGMALRRRPDNHHTHRKDKFQRSQFLRLHVHEVIKIVNEGVPLFGYLHWSLIDNYEWGTFTPRFGLFSIDYSKGTDRQETDHLGDTPSKTYAELIQSAREKMRPIP